MEKFRRQSPRIDVEALCWEVSDAGEVSAMAIDLSQGGVRIERPYVGGRTPKVVPLQLEVPGIDEVMWARGEACFDHVRIGDHGGLMRRTGYRIQMAASRERRMIRDYVYDMDSTRRRLAADFATLTL
jgi:hypothetical protein